MIQQSDFFYTDLRTGSTTAGKPKTISTTYPTNPTFNNPGQVMMKLAQDPDVRKFFQTKMGQASPLSQTNMWQGGQHILESLATGSPVTQVIQQQDQSFIAEATKNSNPLQMLHRLRLELNTADFNQFIPKAKTGLMQTFQSLLSGGGLSGLSGLQSSLLSAFTSIGSQAQSTGTTQNAAIANNQILDASLTPITTNPTASA